jgi:hypothetical protein
MGEMLRDNQQADGSDSFEAAKLPIFKNEPALKINLT